MICKQCKCTITNNEYYIYDPDETCYCSLECYQKRLAEEKDAEDRSFLYTTIRRIHNITFPSARMLGEIKLYREKQGISYRQQASILHYVYEVAQKERPWDGLNAIPKYRDEARQYYEDIKKRRIQVENFVEPQPVGQVLPSYTVKSVKKNKKIDLDSI